MPLHKLGEFGRDHFVPFFVRFSFIVWSCVVSAIDWNIIQAGVDNLLFIHSVCKPSNILRPAFLVVRVVSKQLWVIGCQLGSATQTFAQRLQTGTTLTGLGCNRPMGWTRSWLYSQCANYKKTMTAFVCIACLYFHFDANRLQQRFHFLAYVALTPGRIGRNQRVMDQTQGQRKPRTVVAVMVTTAPFGPTLWSRVPISVRDACIVRPPVTISTLVCESSFSCANKVGAWFI